MALYSRIDDPLRARPLSDEFFARMPARRQWFAALLEAADPPVRLDGTADSLDRLAEWFERLLDAGVVLDDPGDRALYTRRSAWDRPWHVRMDNLILQARGRPCVAPTTDRRARGRAEFVAEVLAVYLAEVARTFDPTLRWAVSEAQPGYAHAGMPALTGDSGWVHPLQPAEMFVSMAMAGVRDPVYLRTVVLAELNGVNLGPPHPPYPVLTRGEPPPPLPFFVRHSRIGRTKMLIHYRKPEPPAEVGSWTGDYLEVSEYEDEEWTHEIVLAEELAHLDEEVVAAYIEHLRRRRGVRQAEHEDREVILVRAPRLRAAVLGTEGEAWIRRALAEKDSRATDQ